MWDGERVGGRGGVGVWGWLVPADAWSYPLRCDLTLTLVDPEMSRSTGTSTNAILGYWIPDRP